MAKVDTMVQDFLAQKKIAVVGVSDKRETGCNLAYKKFKENGYQVFGVNPRMSTYEGDVVYADLKSIPEKPDAVFILASPKVTDEIVQQCVDLGYQACLDALHDGYQAWVSRRHDQRLAGGGGNVQS